MKTVLLDDQPPDISLELTGLSWSFARLLKAAIEIGEREPAALATLQLSLDH
jgi:hypothetical protein